MKILVLNSILYTSNGYVHRVQSICDTMIYNMCLGFKENDCDVTLAAAKEYEPTENKNYDIRILFFKSFLCKVFKPDLLPFSLELLSFLKQHHKDYDLIISSEVFSFPSLFASMFCPRRTVIWHELAIHPHLLFKLPSKGCYNIICRLFMKRVFVIPRSLSARLFISRYCDNVSKICVEHGVNLQKFKCCVEKENYFTYVGQLVSGKNVGYLISAFNDYIKESENDTKLLICGDGPLKNHLIEMTQKMKIDKNVLFLGNLNHENLNNVIMKSMGCLISTKQDNNMLSIPESIVSGTPVLTNSIPTNSYIIKEKPLVSLKII